MTEYLRRRRRKLVGVAFCTMFAAEVTVTRFVLRINVSFLAQGTVQKLSRLGHSTLRHFGNSEAFPAWSA